MFTGLIAGVGRLAAREARGGDLRLRIDAGTLPFDDAAARREHRGQRRVPDRGRLRRSALRGRRLQRDAGADHARRACRSARRSTSSARCCRPTRLGGHLVSGHVDGVGRVARDRRRRARAALALRRAAAAAALHRAARARSASTASASPSTRSTTPASRSPDAAHDRAHRLRRDRASAMPVNLEVDLIARYVERLLQDATSAGAARMSFAPIPELLEEIRAGRMVVIVDDEDRENEGDLIMAAELVRPADINFMVTPCARPGLPVADARALPPARPAADGAATTPRRTSTNFTVSDRGGRRRHHRHLRLRPRAHHPHRGAPGRAAGATCRSPATSSR